MVRPQKALFVVFESFFNTFGPVCVLEPAFCVFVDLFALRPRSRRIEDLRRATAAARRAGHHGLICVLNRRLPRRFLARGGKVPRALTTLETPENQKTPKTCPNHVIRSRKRYEKRERELPDLPGQQKPKVEVATPDTVFTNPKTTESVVLVTTIT